LNEFNNVGVANLSQDLLFFEYSVRVDLVDDFHNEVVVLGICHKFFANEEIKAAFPYIPYLPLTCYLMMYGPQVAYFFSISIV
jgi:hypothetical protein